MKNLRMLLLSTLAVLAQYVNASVVISDDFTSGVGDNIAPNFVTGTSTDVGGVIWRGAGNFRHNSFVGGGAAVPQNILNANALLYLDYSEITHSGQVTTLTAKALVDDASFYDVGFAVDDGFLSGSSESFFARVTPGGAATFFATIDSTITNLGTVSNIKATIDDIIEFTLVYNESTNEVSGTVVGGADTLTLVATSLGATKAGFDQFTFEMRSEGGARSNAGYYDDISVSVSAIPEPSTYGLIFAVLTAGVCYLRRSNRSQI